VSDIAASVDFYTRALGMVSEAFVVADGTERMALKFGDQKINLHLAGQAFQPHSRAPLPGPADLCLLSEQPITAWGSRF